jgi:hypothetical protein
MPPLGARSTGLSAAFWGEFGGRAGDADYCFRRNKRGRVVLTAVPTATMSATTGTSFVTLTRLLVPAFVTRLCPTALLIAIRTLPATLRAFAHDRWQPAENRRQSVSARPRRQVWDVQSRSHFHQIGEGLGLHFSHHPASMCFHRNLADADIATDLFVQQDQCHECDDLPFATAE